MRKSVLALALLLVVPLLALGSPATAQAAVPNPVVIIGGTAGASDYDTLGARLRADGYSVTFFGLPGDQLGDVHADAIALRAHVDSVRQRTGAAKVNLVAHSKGGLVARDYVKFLGGATNVDKLIALGAPNNGTLLTSLLNFLGLGNCLGVVACNQMAIGSAYLKNLNAGDDSIGNVRYTNIATKLDEVVNPYQTAFLNASDGNIANITLQDQCLFRLVEHFGLVKDATVYSGIRQALQGNAVRMNCSA